MHIVVFWLWYNESMIFDHTSYAAQARLRGLGDAKYNGAYYYSKEIVENIIPRVDTWRNWVTMNVAGMCYDHSIVFIHNNLNPEETYRWLSHYYDLVLVCGIPETCEKVAKWGTPIYLPLSVDVDYVRQFKRKLRIGTAYAGRLSKRNENVPERIPSIGGMPRENMLKEMSEYKRIYAVGRTALEAKVLGAKVLPYDDRFPDVDRWKVLDNKDAAKILQKELDRLK